MMAGSGWLMYTPTFPLRKYDVVLVFVRLFHKRHTSEVLPVSHRLLEQCLVKA